MIGTGRPVILVAKGKAKQWRTGQDEDEYWVIVVMPQFSCDA